MLQPMMGAAGLETRMAGFGSAGRTRPERCGCQSAPTLLKQGDVLPAPRWLGSVSGGIDVPAF